MVETAELLAMVLDTTVKIPGTPLYLGLDPLLGLIPGIADVIVNLIGTVILGLAARLQVPQIVIARMAVNLLINGTAGAIPVFGDLFSVWFRSNARNAVLLGRWRPVLLVGPTWTGSRSRASSAVWRSCLSRPSHWCCGWSNRSGRISRSRPNRRRWTIASPRRT